MSERTVKKQRWVELPRVWRCECGENIAELDTLPENHPDPRLRGKRLINFRLNQVYTSDYIADEEEHLEVRGRCRRCGIRHDIPINTKVRADIELKTYWPEIIRFGNRDGTVTQVTRQEMLQSIREREEKKLSR